MRFAFIIMGEFNNKDDRASIHDGTAQIIGVSNIDEAIEVAEELYKSGIDCIELCGAFGEENAKKIIQMTENKIPIGHIVHLPEQDEVYLKAFSH